MVFIISFKGIPNNQKVYKELGSMERQKKRIVMKILRLNVQL